MAETLSPNPTQPQKQRPSVLSPINTFVLGSNNDELERAQARAARAAFIRRKAVTVNNAAADSNRKDKSLDREQIMELLKNCIKLASENKINQKNTWELNLLDHICEIIKVEEVNDVETNFQKASCTLEAGVKIYSMRVDSVHAEAYKVLGAINRVGLDVEQDSVDEGNADSDQVKQTVKKDQQRKLSPLSTLEPSFESLNVKKFDVAFAVDPLYHQTSAQFDEGGAKGLLLNNLGVYGGCRVLFDSLEVPGKCMSCSVQSNVAETIDISYVKDSMKEMSINILKINEITPSLKDIINMYDENSRVSPDVLSFTRNSAETEYDYEAYDNNDFECYQDDASGARDSVDDHENGPTYDGPDDRAEPSIPIYHEENDEYVSNDLDADKRFVSFDDFMFLKRGLSTTQNAWAGPDHWKFHKSKGPEDHANEDRSQMSPKKTRIKKQVEVDIEFTKALDDDMADIFAPPKNLKSLLLPENRERCNTTLPEDVHYQPMDLVKLFLLPNVMFLGKRGRRHSDELDQEETNGAFPSQWDDDDCGPGDQYDDGNAYSDVEDSSTLVFQPRQVEKIEVRYDRKSKQVDVHILKETLWSSMQEIQKSTHEETLSFKNTLASFKTDVNRPAAASIDDISPHLCFICLLHLANEHGLSIQGSPDLDDLSIHLP
ncbi:condensin complex subunit 2-like [Rutidosis leptorrhynchoides]|uniref:condensin complex subunit 2-like n=1 Tax=Rutidosis leptorrhynchoides TaxID=125765 RepID=UPI003A99C10E